MDPARLAGLGAIRGLAFFRRAMSRGAMPALLLVAEDDGPTMFTPTGAMRAMNRHVERVFDPSRKDKRRRRRKLTRDQ